MNFADLMYTAGIEKDTFSYVIVKLIKREFSDINLGVVVLALISFIVFLVH